MGFGGCIPLIGLSSNLFVISAGGFFMFASLPLINIGAEVLIRKNIMRSDQGKMWGALADQLVKVLGRAPGGEIR